VQIGGERRAVHARVAGSEERAGIWQKAVRVWPAFREYQARSKGREIPVVVLERR
jgi:deazaflavin-dependent oxidoreductase (nitroreductase family)